MDLRIHSPTAPSNHHRTQGICLHFLLSNPRFVEKWPDFSHQELEVDEYQTRLFSFSRSALCSRNFAPRLLIHGSGDYSVELVKDVEKHFRTVLLVITGIKVPSPIWHQLGFAWFMVVLTIWRILRQLEIRQPKIEDITMLEKTMDRNRALLMFGAKVLAESVYE